MSVIEERGYKHPELLVSTDWVAGNLENPAVRIVESNEDPLLYPSGHIPGAVEVDWTRDLNHPVLRDYLRNDGFEKLMSRIGATRDTTIVFYGDKNNWWACYAFWVFQLFGHEKARVMDGGRLKWEKEGRPLVRDVPRHPATEYRAPERDDSRFRAFRDQVMEHVRRRGALSTFAARPSTAESVSTWRTTPTKGPCGEDTFREPPMCPGPGRSIPRTEPSRQPTNYAGSTRGNMGSTRTKRWSPTAGSASGAATPGSC